jgi:hypothetical protein
MTEDQLRELLRECLGECFTTHVGQVLYSGIDTIRKGTAYFLGLNPAADGTGKILCESPLGLTNWSAYTQQCWYCGDPRSREDHQKRPHQRRVRKLMAELRLTPENTFAANMIFRESRDAAGLDRKTCDPCWRVHQHLLAIIRPDYIVCLGNGSLSPFSLLRFRDKKKGREWKARDDRFKRFLGTFDLGNPPPLIAKVLGVRHPSRFGYVPGLREFAEID